jgi:uncharacterized caspase-like protein
MLQRKLANAIAHLALMVLAFGYAFQPDSACAEKRVALVIGNSEYPEDLTLRNPRNDAKAFAESLKKISPKFEITTIFDMKAADRETVLQKFQQQAINAEVALFYYAGHAVQSNDDNYLLPVDMPEYPSSLAELNALQLNDVLGRMKGATRARIVFLDACRSNPFKKQEDALQSTETRTRRRAAPLIRSLRDGLASPDASNFGTGDIIIAYATAPGSVAQDGEGKNSPFTSALIQYVDQPGLEIKKMQTLVTKAVKQITHDTQIPWFSVSLTSDLYLWPPQPVSHTTNRSEIERDRQRPGRRESAPPGLGGGVGAGGL